MRLGIRQKLTISYLLIALFVGLLGFVSYYGFKGTAQQSDVITKLEVPNLVLLSKMESDILEGMRDAITYPLLNDSEGKIGFYEQLNQFEIAAATFKEDNHIGDDGKPIETELFKGLISSKETMVNAAFALFENYERDGVANISLMIAFEEEVDIVVPIINRLLEFEANEVERANQIIDEKIAFTYRLIVIVVSMTVLFSLILGFFVSKSISSPINKLNRAATRVGRGELDTLIEIKTKDEIGDLALAFSKMTQSLKERTIGLEGANAQLNVEVSEHKRAVAALAQRAEELDRSNEELEQFAYVASHDLQEPLRKIQGFANRLEASQADAFNEKGKDYLTRMTNAASRMQTLIEDLLLFARISSNGMAFRSVDLNKIAAEVIEDLEGAIERTSARIEIGDLPTVDADPSQMRQLIQNLVSNAIKFQKSGEPPVVRIHETNVVAGKNNFVGYGDSVRFTVEDEGIGFEPQYADRIFGVFQRLHGKDEYPGTGVGLAVCLKIAKRHGGTITATGEPGHGARFDVSLLKHKPEEGYFDE